MGKRFDLSAKFHDLVNHVYFQPPTGTEMQYPCIVYKIDADAAKFADNHPYSHCTGYLVTVIDSNPDSELPGKIADFPMSSFVTKFTSDDLNHTVYKIYY